MKILNTILDELYEVIGNEPEWQIKTLVTYFNDKKVLNRKWTKNDFEVIY